MIIEKLIDLASISGRHFLGVVFFLWLVMYYFLFYPMSVLRELVIRKINQQVLIKNGWPPLHCNVDGEAVEGEDI